MRKDDFGDRMKAYEASHESHLLEGLPWAARIDGRSFSKFTKGMERPFDDVMTATMAGVTRHLVKETKASIGYTQSDEITLIFKSTDLFGGRVQKLASVLAGMTSSAFVLNFPYRDRAEARVPHFDCRVFGVPNETEASNALLWRAQDCRKNAVQSVARAFFSHKQLDRKSQAEMLEMLAERGVSMDDYSPFNVHGMYFQRKLEERSLTAEEAARIPTHKRPEPGMVFTRSRVEELDMDYFGDYSNREAIIFEGAEPCLNL